MHKYKAFPGRLRLMLYATKEILCCKEPYEVLWMKAVETRVSSGEFGSVHVTVENTTYADMSNRRTSSRWTAR